VLTPQEVNEKGFDKAVFNGYDMGDVDDFLDLVSNDYNALYKENAILKGKLKVLVEKVEEYRSTEDAMRMALLNAQRMGDDITEKANKERDELLQKTEDEVQATLGEVESRRADEETRLALATKETAKFIELSQAIMRKHAEFLEKLENARRVSKPTKAASKAPASKPPANKASANRAVVPPQASTPAVRAPKPAPRPAPKPAIPVDSKHVTPVTTAPPHAVKTITPAPNHDANIDDIALQIGSIVEDVSEDNTVPTLNNSPQSEVIGSPQSLFEDDLNSQNLSDDGNNSQKLGAAPRPKFDFDDLKFGSNFDLDD